MKLTLKNFKAAMPKIQAKLLPTNYAQYALNTKIGTGAITPYKTPKFLENAPTQWADPYIVMRYKGKDGRYSLYYHYEKINVVKGPVFNDDSNKVYYTGAGSMWVHTHDTLAGQNTLASPGHAPRIVASVIPGRETQINVRRAHDGIEPPIKPTDLASPTYNQELVTYNEYYNKTAEHRAYCHIFVREWPDGQIDMGGPTKGILCYTGDWQDGAFKYSDAFGDTPSTVAVRSGEVVYVGIPYQPAELFRTRGITRCYIYRTAVTTSGEVLFRLANIFRIDPDNLANTETDKVVVSTSDAGISNWVFVDTVSSGDLLEEMVSGNWEEWPPIDDIVCLSNGVVVGYKDHEIFYSEPYQPHAYKQSNRIAIDTPIVGAAAFEYTAVLLTKSTPILVTIQDTGNPIVRPIKDVLPCLSKTSISSFGKGVMYASDTGLILLNQNTPINLTQRFFNKEQWMALNPKTLVGDVYEDKYFGFFETPTTIKGFVIDLLDMEAGITYLDDSVQAVFVDPEGSGMYVLTNGQPRTYMYDAEARKSYTWRSKVFVSPEGLMTLAAARVDGDFSNGAIMFDFYADGDLKHSEYVTSNTPFRLPSGFRHEQFEVEVTSKSDLYDIQLASSMGELIYD